MHTSRKPRLTHSLTALLAGAALVAAPVALTACDNGGPTLEVTQGSDDSEATTRDAGSDDASASDKSVDATSTGGEKATYGDISVTIPDGWSAYQNDNEVTLRAVTNSNDNGAVVIEITPVNQEVTSEELMKGVAADYIREQASDEDSFAIKGKEDDQSVFQIDGHYAVTVEWEFEDDSEVYQGTTTLIAVGKEVYEVECEALSSYYDSVKGDFDRVISSIVIS